MTGLGIYITPLKHSLILNLAQKSELEEKMNLKMSDKWSYFSTIFCSIVVDRIKSASVCINPSVPFLFFIQIIH